MLVYVYQLSIQLIDLVKKFKNISMKNKNSHITIFLFITVIFLFGCSNPTTNENNREIAYLKSSNKQLKIIVDDTYSQYIELSNNDIVEEIVDSCGYFINEIEKNNINSKKFNEIKGWLINNINDDFNDVDFDIVTTEIGRQLFINKILSYELSQLSDFKKRKMLRFFQTDMVKLVSVKDTISYAKNIQLNIETKYSCRAERVKIIYQGDTILDNQNIFSIKYSNPKRGENILKVPFIYKRWGKETQFDSVEVKFYVK